MTGEEHNKYLSWVFLANGLFQALMLLAMFGFLIMVFSIAPPEPDFPGAFLAFIFGFALLINLVFISPNFVAYYALKNRKP